MNSFFNRTSHVYEKRVSVALDAWKTFPQGCLTIKGSYAMDPHSQMLSKINLQVTIFAIYLL